MSELNLNKRSVDNNTLADAHQPEAPRIQDEECGTVVSGCNGLNQSDLAKSKMVAESLSNDGDRSLLLDYQVLFARGDQKTDQSYDQKRIKLNHQEISSGENTWKNNVSNSKPSVGKLIKQTPKDKPDIAPDVNTTECEAKAMASCNMQNAMKSSDELWKTKTKELETIQEIFEQQAQINKQYREEAMKRDEEIRVLNRKILEMQNMQKNPPHREANLDIKSTGRWPLRSNTIIATDPETKEVLCKIEIGKLAGNVNAFENMKKILKNKGYYFNYETLEYARHELVLDLR